MRLQALFVLLVALVIMVYSISETRVETSDPLAMAREVETPAKLWINGYLGQFFRFKYVGNMNWLFIPCIVYLLWARGLQRWQLALLFTFVISSAVIGLLGFQNYRYMFTFVPFTLTVMLLLVAQWTTILQRRGAVAVLCVFVVLMSAVNYNEFRDLYRAYYATFVSDGEGTRVPWKVLGRINRLSISEDERMLVCCAPFYYYFCDTSGLPYNKSFVSSIDDRGVADEYGIDNIFHEVTGNDRGVQATNIARGFSTLRKKYKVKYVVVGTLPYYYREVTEMLKNGADLIESESGYSLYKLKDEYFNPAYETATTVPALQLRFSVHSNNPALEDWGPLRVLPPQLKAVAGPELYRARYVSDGEERFLRVSKDFELELVQEETPTSPQASPSLQQVTPSPQQVTPSSQQVTPSPQQVTPSPQQVTPSPQQVTPSPQQVTPSPQQVTPSPQQATPSPQQVAPSPQQDGRTAERDSRTAQQDTLSPQQDTPASQRVTPYLQLGVSMEDLLPQVRTGDTVVFKIMLRPSKKGNNTPTVVFLGGSKEDWRLRDDGPSVLFRPSRDPQWQTCFVYAKVIMGRVPPFAGICYTGDGEGSYLDIKDMSVYVVRQRRIPTP